MVDNELPQQRRTNRAVMGWGIGAALGLCAVVLIWAFVFIPHGQLGSTARQATGGPTGQLANQGSGQSNVAKNDSVVPQTSTTVGAGQNSPAAAAQIEKSAGPLQLSNAQRAKIRSYFADHIGDRTDTTDFALSVGAAVPQQARLQKLPPQIAAALGGYQGDEYILVRNQLVIVDSNARRVVAVIPGTS